MQLEDSETIRSELLEKTRIMIADLKRQNQKLHEENVQLKHQVEEARMAGNQSQIRTELRTKLHTHESSKERNSKTRLIGFEGELKRQYGSDLK